MIAHAFVSRPAAQKMASNEVTTAGPNTRLSRAGIGYRCGASGISVLQQPDERSQLRPPFQAREGSRDNLSRIKGSAKAAIGLKCGEFTSQFRDEAPGGRHYATEFIQHFHPSPFWDHKEFGNQPAEQTCVNPAQKPVGPRPNF